MEKWAIKMCESKQRKGRGRASAIDWVKGSERLSRGERKNKEKSKRQWLKIERGRLICLPLTRNWNKGQSNVWGRVKWEKCNSEGVKSETRAMQTQGDRERDLKIDFMGEKTRCRREAKRSSQRHSADGIHPPRLNNPKKVKQNKIGSASSSASAQRCNG